MPQFCKLPPHVAALSLHLNLMILHSCDMLLAVHPPCLQAESGCRRTVRGRRRRSGGRSGGARAGATAATTATGEGPGQGRAGPWARGNALVCGSLGVLPPDLQVLVPHTRGGLQFPAAIFNHHLLPCSSPIMTPNPQAAGSAVFGGRARRRAGRLPWFLPPAGAGCGGGLRPCPHQPGGCT